MNTNLVIKSRIAEIKYEIGRLKDMYERSSDGIRLRNIADKIKSYEELLDFNNNLYLTINDLQ